jgi:hypothetical protein
MAAAEKDRLETKQREYRKPFKSKKEQVSTLITFFTSLLTADQNKLVCF